MTAYGRASLDGEQGYCVVEILSVNRKMLDVSVYLPKDFLRFETEVRQWIARQIERGQVTVRIHFQLKEMGDRRWDQLKAGLRRAQAKWGELAKELGFNPQEAISLPFLVDQMEEVDDLWIMDREPEIRSILQETVGKALVSVMQMKRREGEVLGGDIRERLQRIEKSLLWIEQRKRLPVEKYQKKLEEKVQELLLSAEWQDRMGKEVALMAEKLDITEELVRAHSHIQQFNKNLSCADKAIGRTLDFLVQEMSREINTLSVKSQDSEMIAEAIKIKSELEKIREQVQNIE